MRFAVHFGLQGDITKAKVLQKAPRSNVWKGRRFIEGSMRRPPCMKCGWSMVNLREVTYKQSPINMFKS